MRLSKVGFFTALACTICGATFATVHTIDSAKGKAFSEPRSTAFYARRNIPKGMMINMAFLAVREIPTDTVPADATRDFQQLVGRIARNEISAGTVISKRDLMTLVSPPEGQ